MAKSKAQGLRRPKGEGSVTILPNGHVKITVTIGVGVDGKQVRRSCTGKTRKEALEKIAKLRVMKPNAHNPIPLMKDFFKAYIEENTKIFTENTHHNYRTMWNVLGAQLGPLRLNRITPEYLNSLLPSLRNQSTGEPLASGSLLVFKRCLSAIFNNALEKNMIEKNPCNKILRGVKQRFKSDLPLPTPEQIKKLLEDLKMFDEEHKDRGIRLYPIFLLALSTGARKGELLGLRKAFVHEDTIEIRSQVTANLCDQPLKTLSSIRIIKVAPAVLQVVMGMANTECDFVFPGLNHGYIKDMLFSNYVSRFYRKYGKPTPDFTFHMCRHFNATEALRHGIDIKSVSKRLGHSSVLTTLRLYAHWIPEADERAAQIVGENYL